MLKVFLTVLLLGLVQVGCGGSEEQRGRDSVEVSETSSALYTTCSPYSYSPCEGQPVGALCGDGLGRTAGPRCRLTGLVILGSLCECRHTPGGGGGGSGGGGGGSGGGGGGPLP